MTNEDWLSWLIFLEGPTNHMGFGWLNVDPLPIYDICIMIMANGYVIMTKSSKILIWEQEEKIRWQLLSWPDMEMNTGLD